MISNPSSTKADVGLGNVDNTSDPNKPVSTATQTALNAKSNIVLPDSDRIIAFKSALKTAGLDTALVDGALFRKNQNSATAPTTLNGSAITLIGSPVLGDGLLLNLAGATSQAARFTIQDTRASTIVIEYEGTKEAQLGNGTIYCSSAAAGHATATNGTWVWSSGNANSDPGRVGTSNAGGAYAYTDFTYSDAGSDLSVGIQKGDPYLHTLAFSNDNASPSSVKAYVDGALCVSNTNGVQVTSSITSITLGARATGAGSYDQYCKGNYKSVLIFNRVLTQAEIQTVEFALRWLDPAPVNVIIDGDSRQAHYNSGTALDIWTQVKEAGYFGNARFYNLAKSGIPAYVAQNRPDRFTRRAPGGPVKKTIYTLTLGINDIQQNNVTGTAAYSYLKPMWAAARAAGEDVYVGTVFGGALLTDAQETQRQALNTLILSDPSQYIKCYRFDVALSDPTNTQVFLNSLHANTYGNTIQAMCVTTNNFSALRPPSSPAPLAMGASIATDASLGSVFYGTLTVSGTLANPTNVQSAQVLKWFLKNTTGAETLTLGGKFATGPWTVTLSTAAGATDYIEAVYDLTSDKFRITNFQKGY